MNKRLVVAIAIAAGLSGAELAGAGEPTAGLQHNPFTRPELGGVAAASAGTPPPAAIEPELRATLVAGDDSLANVAGELLGVGADVNGYRLTHIGEGFANFERDGQVITVFIRRAGKRTKGRR